MQLPMFHRKVFWLYRLHSAISRAMTYYDCADMGRASTIVGPLLLYLWWLKSTHAHIPLWNRDTGFALGAIYTVTSQLKSCYVMQLLGILTSLPFRHFHSRWHYDSGSSLSSNSLTVFLVGRGWEPFPKYVELWLSNSAYVWGDQAQGQWNSSFVDPN